MNSCLVPSVFALVLSVSFASAPLAATHSVEPGGGGDFATIQQAVDAAADGDVVLLTDGVFRGTGNRDIDLRGKRIEVRSEGGDPRSCIIDCEAYVFTRHRGFYVHRGEGPGTVIEGIGVVNGYAPTTPENWGGGILVIDSSPTIRNCAFSVSHAGWGGGMLFWNSDSRVSDCHVEFNTASANGGGIYVTEGATVEFETLTIHGNETSGRGGGLVFNDCSPSLSNSTVAFNQGVEGSGLWVLNGATATIENSILAFGQGSAVACDGGGAAILFCTDVFGNAGGDWVGCISTWGDESGNISLDPLFCDPENFDFGLDASSPCLPGLNDCGVLMGAVDHGCGSAQGACCDTESGACFVTYPTICAIGAGEYLGDFTNCDPNPCPAANGACCERDGSCTVVTEAACEVVNGMFLGVLTNCDPDPCDVSDVEPQSTRATLRLDSPRPNPAARSVELSFELPSSGRVSLRLIDSAGRVVASVLDQELPAGVHRQTWERGTGRTAELASGVYQVELRYADRVRTSRLVLLD